MNKRGLKEIYSDVNGVTISLILPIGFLITCQTFFC